MNHRAFLILTKQLGVAYEIALLRRGDQEIPIGASPAAPRTFSYNFQKVPGQHKPV